MPREPESTHSFLLTDIEGSTQSWERHAGPMHDALDAHDKIFASVIARQDGELLSHTGDGICATFDSPESALRAAVEAQLALRDVAVDRTGALKVRMGIHHGTVVHSGDRRFGPTLNRCARMMSAALDRSCSLQQSPTCSPTRRFPTLRSSIWAGTTCAASRKPYAFSRSMRTASNKTSLPCTVRERPTHTTFLGCRRPSLDVSMRWPPSTNNSSVIDW
jgi:hypothetical protein